MKENALNKVRTDLVLQEIIKAENIEVTEEELKKLKKRRMAQQLTTTK